MSRNSELGISSVGVTIVIMCLWCDISSTGAIVQAVDEMWISHDRQDFGLVLLVGFQMHSQEFVSRSDISRVTYFSAR